MKSKLIILTSHSTFESGGVGGTHLATMKSSLSNKNHTFILGLSKKSHLLLRLFLHF